MNLIVAVDKNWGIGKNNDLLFHLPEDMRYFKEKTLNKVVVMGGNTLLSFPGARPLPKRKNLVLSDVFTRDDCDVFATLAEVKNEIKKYDANDVFVVGGAMFYRTMLPYCQNAYITKVDADGEAELFFPNLDNDANWIVESVSEEIESNGTNIRFYTYKNLKVKSLDE